MAPMQAERLTPALGARVTGIDTTQPWDSATRDKLVELFHAHQVLVIPGPVWSPHQHVAFVRQLGEPDGSDTSRYHPPVDVDGFQ